MSYKIDYKNVKVDVEYIYLPYTNITIRYEVVILLNIVDTNTVHHITIWDYVSSILKAIPLHFI